MLNIVLLAFASVGLICCGAFAASVRSPDEEDSPQASAEAAYVPQFLPSSVDAHVQAARRALAASRRPAAVQEDDKERY